MKQFSPQLALHSLKELCRLLTTKLYFNQLQNAAYEALYVQVSKHEYEYGPSEEMNTISRLGKALSTSSDKFSSGDPELTQKQK